MRPLSSAISRRVPSAACAMAIALLLAPQPVHAQSAGPAAPVDPPCFDTENRYVDCGNGTVTDTVTGLVWLQDPECLGVADWASSAARAATLADGACGLTDGSWPGAWRLPTLEEWLATIARAVSLGCTGEGPGAPPALTNDAGTACLSDGPMPFAGVAPGSYWSLAADEQHPNNAWAVSLAGTVHGFAYPALKSFALPAWAVRRP